MAGVERVTRPLLDVLEVLYQAHGRAERMHGWAIISATKRAGPTVYRVLDRLEDAGWVRAEWESVNPDPAKPRRRFYELNPTGLCHARELLVARRPAALEAKGSGPTPRPALGTWFGPLSGGAR